jgi:hypothetical protein
LLLLVVVVEEGVVDCPTVWKKNNPVNPMALVPEVIGLRKKGHRMDFAEGSIELTPVHR